MFFLSNALIHSIRSCIFVLMCLQDMCPFLISLNTRLYLKWNIPLLPLRRLKRQITDRNVQLFGLQWKYVRLKEERNVLWSELRNTFNMTRIKKVDLYYKMLNFFKVMLDMLENQNFYKYWDLKWKNTRYTETYLYSLHCWGKKVGMNVHVWYLVTFPFPFFFSRSYFYDVSSTLVMQNIGKCLFHVDLSMLFLKHGFLPHTIIEKLLQYECSEKNFRFVIYA